MRRGQFYVLALLGGTLFARNPSVGDPAAKEPASTGWTNVAGESLGPDVFVFDLKETANWGSNTVNNEGVAAFSVGTDSCNAGDENILWVAESDDHPVIRQNLYRLQNNRFEHIGTSWVKHGFYATNYDYCSSECVPFIDGYQLAPGCSDLYSGQLNGDRSFLGPSSDVNAFTGEFTWPRSIFPQDVGNINFRLQAKHADIDPALNPGAKFFVDGHYVARDDAAAGNWANNVSHRAARISGCQLPTWPAPGYCIALENQTQEMMPAIYAWKEQDPTVRVTEQRVPAEGMFILGARFEELGDGFWRYEYALYNMNSHRSAGLFRVPIPESATVRNIGFHDVNYHSGEPWDGTDWPGVVDADSIVWAVPPPAPPVPPENANALRWSTLYNFRFEINAQPTALNDPPGDSAVAIGLFRHGFPAGIAIRTVGPALSIIDCNKNGIEDRCDVSCEEPGCGPKTCGQSEDCNKNGVPDHPLCEADCDGNQIPDDCDIRDCEPRDLSCGDCNSNTVPDGCEDDCDKDGIPNTCEKDVDVDDDGFEDCDDLCPHNTPPNGCTPPQIVTCLFPNGFCVNGGRQTCILHGGRPMCGEPPSIRCEYGYPCPESRCKNGCIVGDLNLDGDVDFSDFWAFQVCFGGSGGGPDFGEPSAECLLRFDFEEDGDVDLVDYHDFEDVLRAPN